MSSEITVTHLSRREKLEVWMRREGVTFVALGRHCGVTPYNVAKLLRQETMPVRRHEQLAAFGVPAELLPAPLDIKPGPKPRTDQGVFAA